MSSSNKQRSHSFDCSEKKKKISKIFDDMIISDAPEEFSNNNKVNIFNSCNSNNDSIVQNSNFLNLSVNEANNDNNVN